MITPKLLLNPVFKDLYKSKTTFQSHSSLKGVLQCRQSGLLCSVSSQCLCFYYCPTWAFLQTQPLMHPHSTFCFPHEIFSFHIWCYISPPLNLHSIYRPYYSLSFILLCVIFFFSFVSCISSQCQLEESNMLYILYSVA